MTRLYDCEQDGNEIKVKVGLAAFATLATNSQSVFMQLGGTGTRFTSLCWRATQGGSMEQIVGSDHTWAPFWLRLKREGNTFTGFVSVDGKKWNAIGTCEVSLPSQAYVGLFVCGGQGHNDGFTARFDHLQLTSGTTAPAAPASLQASATSSTAVSLSWGKVDGASSYTLWRASEANGSYSAVASNLKNNSYGDTHLQPSTTYYYKVSAGNAAGEGALSDAVEVTTMEQKLPGAPTALKAKVGNNSIRLSWTATAEMTTAYNVYRRKASQVSAALLATTANASYEDTTAVNDTAYYYSVKAVNSLGEGPASAEVRATPSLSPVLYLPLNEAQGTKVYNAYDNKAAGSLSYKIAWANARYDSGIRLTSANSCVATLNSGIVSSLNDFTISVWVRPTTLDKWARAWDFGTGTSEYMFLSVKSDKGKPKFAIRHDGTEEAVEGSSAIAVNAWTHLVVTLHDSVATLYVNGQTAGRNLAVGHRPSQLGTTTQNYLGQSQWSNDAHYNGMMDELRIYGQALTASQVKELFQARRQTIAMDDSCTKVVGDKPFHPATATSGLPVSLRSSRYAVAAAAGDSVTIKSTGTSLITARQVGNLSWVAAVPKTMRLIVTATDGIDQPTTGTTKRTGTYTLSGIRIPDGTALRPGLYIIDGRKVIVR
jgi:hypothetical protein